ncbi:hypothetical protein BC835DRAFT_1310761 [Cytidiella melzeri]|nr:hypothetical protein BC835DRAFT_1310761 [Cytidiella melzeri]
MSHSSKEAPSVVEISSLPHNASITEHSSLWSAAEPRFALGQPLDAGADVDQCLRYRDNAVRSTAITKGSLLLPGIIVWSLSVLPALMGVLFYISLGFNANHGVFYPNGTFVRPIEEGVRFGGENSFLTTHFSPLLLSSISSSLIGMLSPAVMGLVGYHLASLWLRSSEEQTTPTPTPMQYYHTLDLVANASLMAFVRSIVYIVKNGWSRWRSVRRIHARLSNILLIASATMATVLTLAWAIRVIDVVLHSQITSTIVTIIHDSPTSYAANAVIRADCENSTVNACGVINRTNEASLGGLNQSAVFRIYQHGVEDPNRQQSIAFIGPVDPPLNLMFEAHTLVTATHCDVYHPECYVEDETPLVCAPALSNNLSAVPPLDDWNSLPWTQGFNVTLWGMRLQTFLTVKGSLTEPGETPSDGLSSGSNVNPFTTVSFGCFPDYSDIPYSDANMSFRTPFINWWTYGAGIPNKPFQLCSISICNTTVYNAKYTLSNGIFALDNSSFELANASAAVAASGAAMYLGKNDTLYYQWGPRLIDDQMQIDLSAAGNTYGNDTTQFSAAWAQAFSNRYLGWTVGVVQLADQPARVSNPQLALSIPVTMSYAFVALHLLYAAGIFVLGISCLLVASGSSRAGDIQAVHQRLTDTSALVHELTLRSIAAENGDTIIPRSDNGCGGSPNHREVEGEDTKYLDSDIRLWLRRRANGKLGLSFERGT